MSRSATFLTLILTSGLAGIVPLSIGAQSGKAAPQLSPQLTSAGSVTGTSLDWDAAFDDQSAANPIHFVAAYLDGTGKTHRLEEWRVGLTHLRRRTDTAIDLHADAAAPPRPNQPVQYQWQILDLAQKIDHRVSSQGMLRAGMLYSYYAMAHVLTRPSGRFEIHEVQGLAPIAVAGVPCRWFEIASTGQPSSRVCWASAIGLPLRTLAETRQGWRTNFELSQLDQRPIPPAIFAVDSKGFRVRNLEELENDD